MNPNFLRQLIAVVVFFIASSSVVAQTDEGQGSYALRIYYSDLYLALSPYDMDDIPFERRQIKVAHNDTLIDIARENRFSQLDAFHLAAAIFETNPQAFSGSGSAQLQTGVTLMMPSVADIFVAQDRYEKLKVAGDNLIFDSSENQMRSEQRWPFGKSLVMIGESAKDELPRNQVVTLTSYRPEQSPASPENAGADFLTQAARAQAGSTENAATVSNSTASANAQSQTYSKWLDNSSDGDYSDNDLLDNGNDVVASSAPLTSASSQTTSSEISLWAETASLLNSDSEVTEIVNLDKLVETSPRVADTTDAAHQQSAPAAAAALPQPPEQTVQKSRYLLSTELSFKAAEPKLANEEQIDESPVPVTQIATASVVQSDVAEKATHDPSDALMVSALDQKPEETVSDTKTTRSRQPVITQIEPEALKADTQLLAANKAVDTPVTQSKDNNQTLQVAVNDPTPVEPAALEDQIVPVIAAVKPLVTTGAGFKAAPNPETNYLRSPSNVDSLVAPADTADPLSYIVEWRFDHTATVGAVMEKLADYIGYKLISDHDSVLETYQRKLPAIQRSVNGLSVEEGFGFLAGRGFETVFDHVARSVKHVPRGIVEAQTTAVAEPPLTVSPVYQSFIEAAGVASMLQQFPEDIVSAAGRHANRCDSDGGTDVPSADRIYQSIVSNLTRQMPEPITRSLVDWYESATGRKVLELESLDIDEARLRQFSMDDKRADHIARIYENTVTGRGITDIAVELDYAGWSLSGCQQHAELSGDVKKMREEITYGKNIRKKSSKLESLLRDDLMLSMAYQFSSLSDRELSEYAGVIAEHAGVYAELQQSIVEAIDSEAAALAVAR